jgi:hypothetical protein
MMPWQHCWWNLQIHISVHKLVMHADLFNTCRIHPAQAFCFPKWLQLTCMVCCQHSDTECRYYTSAGSLVAVGATQQRQYVAPSHQALIALTCHQIASYNCLTSTGYDIYMAHFTQTHGTWSPSPYPYMPAPNKHTKPTWDYLPKTADTNIMPKAVHSCMPLHAGAIIQEILYCLTYKVFHKYIRCKSVVWSSFSRLLSWMSISCEVIIMGQYKPKLSSILLIR